MLKPALPSVVMGFPRYAAISSLPTQQSATSIQHQQCTVDAFRPSAGRTNLNNLRPLKRHAPLQKERCVIFATLNVCSLNNNNKALTVNELVHDEQIDFLTITETWNSSGEYITLNEATPAGYKYIEKARSGRGGGLAVIYRDSFELVEVQSPGFTSFEFLAARCKLPEPLLLVSIYRPPGVGDNFIADFSDLLATLCPTFSKLVVIGDFNIHVDAPKSALDNEFMHLLDCLPITQHVHGPTHKFGHTLDLVITSDDVSVANTHIIEPGISDHSLVITEALLTLPPSNTKRSISFRKTEDVDVDLLSSTLAVNLSEPNPALSVEEQVDLYNVTLRDGLNRFAPIKTRTVSFRRSAPWYTDQLRSLKADGRKIERRFRQTGLTVHKQSLKEHRRVYSSALRAARTAYYSTLIDNGHSNPRHLFSTVNRLIKPSSPSAADPSVDDCNRFMDFFQTKIEKIRDNIASVRLATSLPPSSPYNGQTLNCFSELTDAELSKIILGMNSSSSSLDPIPTPLLKSCLSAIIPIMRYIINSIMSTGEVPSSLKIAAIRPVLKKHNLDPEILANYRPISNLPFLAKVLEKAIALQLQEHLKSHQLYEIFQSGFRASHSTETALLRVVNDILLAADSGSPSLLILLDLSAAFDTVDHVMLLQRLQEVGVTDTALKFFQSYLSERQEYVALGNLTSSVRNVTSGVPQGSVLGPLLFLIYMLPLGEIFRRHKINFHSYADDTQIYIQTSPDSPLSISRVTKCLDDIRDWMNNNSLQLNGNKTEAILIGTPNQTKQAGISNITIDGHTIPLSSLVTSLGVKLDQTLSFEAHVKAVCHNCFYQLRTISKLRPILSLPDLEKLVHAFITSRVDYCNSLLAGLPAKTTQRLQYVQNSAARILTKTRKSEHITPVLYSLHWLPVEQRITFKLLLHVFKAVKHTGPAYLQELISPKPQIRPLRSDSEPNLLVVPFTNLATMGDRAFSRLGPLLWNELPGSIRALESISTFKSSLKTHLFRDAFSHLL